MAEPEQAFSSLILPSSPPEGFNRLYFGAEFCFWRFPTLTAVHAALDWCRQVGWSFTLVTPLLNETERPLLRDRLVELLPRMQSGDEVLISDWGALDLLRSIREDLPVILGRALSGQKRGPQIMKMDLSPAEMDYFRQGSFYSSSAVALLADQGIRRVELDNLLQKLAALPSGLQGSLHLPYAMVTSSRNCPFRPVAAALPCPAPCGEVFTLEASDTPIRLLQSGNTQFLENPQPPEGLAELGIDRIVFHPQLPC